VSSPAFGVGLFPTEPAAKLVHLSRLAESLGYDSVWIADSQLIWRELWVTTGAVAGATERVLIGTAVTNPITRDLTVTASAAYTLNELSGGRAALGIGVGDSSVRTLGRTPVKLAELERVIGQIRALNRGEAVDLGTGTARMLAAERQPEDIPIYVAASAPKILELAGRVADGVIVLVGVAESYVRAGLERIHAGARAAGRDPASIRTVLWTPAATVEDPEVTQAVKAHVARIIIRPLPMELEDEDRRVAEAIKSHYDYYSHMDTQAGHGQLVPDAMVSRFALTGDPARCVDAVRAAAAAGIDEIAIVPYATARHDREATVRAFADRVMAAI
jgi:5,10-methylenetetrahydromethanopterin reductase